MEFRSWVRHPCFAVQAKTDENQPDFPLESLLKDKKEAKCLILSACGDTGASSQVAEKRLDFGFGLGKQCLASAHFVKVDELRNLATVGAFGLNCVVVETHEIAHVVHQHPILYGG